jgi:hypothetical protein
LNSPVALASLSLALAGSLASITVLWVLPGAILTGAAAAGAIALMATVGNLGGYVAPYILGLAKDTTGRLEAGLDVMAAAMIAGASLTHFLPRRASIEEASGAPTLKERPATAVYNQIGGSEVRCIALPPRHHGSTSVYPPEGSGKVRSPRIAARARS